MSGARAPIPVTAQAMEHRLQERLAPTRLEVIDESAAHAGHVGANGTGFGTHFRVRISSPLFTDRSRVARHRLVYDALQEFIDQGAHAIAIEVL
jgi:BolA protein